jgi:hypothetical protein
MLKKALLVGINDYPSVPLRGCVNDVAEMKEVLTGILGVETDNLRVLLNREATKQGIIDSLMWLAEGGMEPAMRVFHFAGHGYSVPDSSGDEEDGFDEALAPYDHIQNGFLIDDELKSLYNRFPPNSNLTLIMDCCHSGTIQRDLERDVVFRGLTNTYEERVTIAAAKKKFEQDQREFVRQAVADLHGRNISENEFFSRVELAIKKFKKQRFGGNFEVREGNVLLSACASEERAADAKINGRYHGAFTYYLTRILKETRGEINHLALAEKVGEALNDHAFAQIPQLECDPGRQEAKLFSLF